jgi:hypothetical protein
MRVFGARKFEKREKEVTNKGYWRLEIAEKRKRGHQ